MQKELVFLNFKSSILTSLLWSLKNTAAIHCPKKKKSFFGHNFTANIFLNELNLNFPFYIRQQEYQSPKWNTRSHAKRQISHELSPRATCRVPNKPVPKTALNGRCQNQLAKRPNDTQRSPTARNSRQGSEPVGESAQIAVSAHK